MEPSVHEISQPEQMKLFEDILKKGTHLRTKVTGISMSPFLRDGEVVVIRQVPAASLRVGDILFFLDTQGHSTLHRLMKKKRRLDGRITLHTKGDALIRFDEPIMDDRLIGKVCNIEKRYRGRETKTINLESFAWKTLNGFIAMAQLLRSGLYYGLFIRLKKQGRRMR